VDYENGILAMEFSAPHPGEVLLQLSREPSGQLLAAGHPTSFDWDDKAFRARLPIPEALDTLVGDRFVYTDYDGTVMNKSRFMADIKDPAFHATLIANEDVDVYLYPSAAIVTGTYHTKGAYKGRPFDHWGRFTDTWIRQNNQWQCVASHTNLISK